MINRCIAAGTVQDWELEAIASGEEMPGVAAHLEECDDCRAQVAAIVQEQYGLTRVLFRSNCPTPAVLQDYYWDFLPGAERQDVSAHLAWCPHCSTELETITAFLAEEVETTAETVVARLRSGWASLHDSIRDALEQTREQTRVVLAQLLTPPMQPASVALRGARASSSSGDERQTSFLLEADDTDINLLVQKNQDGTLTLAGQIFAPAPVQTGRCRLVPARVEADIWEVSVDAVGSFTATGLQPDTYQLVVILPETTILAPALEIR